MKQYFLIIIMLFIGLQDILAQHDNDTTLIQKSNSGYSYNGNSLNTRRMKEVLLVNDEASQAYQNALNTRGIAFTFLISGGTTLAGGFIMDPSIGLFKVAGGILILSAIFTNISYEIRKDKAVKIYNNAIKQKYNPENTLSIGLNSNGVGIQFNF
ncbi:MAG: hypothetical protein FD170_1934 [Bacteroidetes bacterium]|nr:MAG: hypothetical protein FD170_1934 [Bacteroidota bacterium]